MNRYRSFKVLHLSPIRQLRGANSLILMLLLLSVLNRVKDVLTLVKSLGVYLCFQVRVWATLAASVSVLLLGDATERVLVHGLYLPVTCLLSVG